MRQKKMFKHLNGESGNQLHTADCLLKPELLFLKKT